MTRRIRWYLAVLPVGVTLCVLASLLGVHLLSEWIGFRFLPGLVAALSGATSAVLLCLGGRAPAR